MRRSRHGTHHGVVSAGSLLTDCGRSVNSARVVQLDLDPDERPPDRDQICPDCLGVVKTQDGGPR